MIATISAPVAGAAIGAVVGLLGVLVGLWVNGDRAERQRRRDLHGRALAAVIDYGEIPFMIRRRRCEPEQRSAERIRLSDHFSKVKAEISTCQVLLSADGHRRVAAPYDELVATARSVVGKEAHDAWEQEPIAEDSGMNMGPLFDRLEEFRNELAAFQEAMARATLPRRLRVARWIHERNGRRPSGT